MFRRSTSDVDTMTGGGSELDTFGRDPVVRLRGIVALLSIGTGVGLGLVGAVTEDRLVRLALEGGAR